MIAQLSLSGLFENLAVASPLLLMILMPVGFIASAWVTNRVFDYLRRDLDEVTTVDKMGTLLLLTSLFATYCYFLWALILE